MPFNPIDEPEHARPEIRVAHRVAVTISAAVLATVPVYIFLVQFLLLRAEHGMQGLDVIRIAFYAIGFSLMLIVKVVQGVLLKKTSGQPAESLLRKLMHSAVVTAVFCEIPAVLGFILFLMGGTTTDFYILAAMTLGMWVVYFPRLRAWQDWLGSSAI